MNEAETRAELIDPALKAAGRVAGARPEDRSDHAQILLQAVSVIRTGKLQTRTSREMDGLHRYVV